LVSLKRYFAWLTEQSLLDRNPAHPIKLVKAVEQASHRMDDQQESAFVATVQHGRRLRDIVLITLMLHTGLRVGEVCSLQWHDVASHPRSGHLKIWGKRHKYREVPLNSTARRVLEELKTQHKQDGDLSTFVFASIRTGDCLTPRAIGFIVKKYARQAGLMLLIRLKNKDRVALSFCLYSFLLRWPLVTRTLPLGQPAVRRKDGPNPVLNATWGLPK